MTVSKILTKRKEDEMAFVTLTGFLIICYCTRTVLLLQFIDEFASILACGFLYAFVFDSVMFLAVVEIREKVDKKADEWNNILYQF